jgi:outer membrane protein TolC
VITRREQTRGANERQGQTSLAGRPAAATQPAPAGSAAGANLAHAGIVLTGAAAEAHSVPDGARANSEANANSNAAANETTLAAQPGQAIDLAIVLELVNGRNPAVMYARERIQEAYAKLDAAQALWLPSLRAGVNWNKHEGRIQDVAGQVFEASRGSYFAGFGADAVGAGSPRVHGLLAAFHLADALFEPQIQERAASAREWGSVAATNDAMLAAVLAYLELQGAYQQVAIAREAQENTRALARLTGDYASTGQGVAADDDRARAELALRDNDVERALEAVEVARARLARQLRLEATLPIEPREPVVTPIDLGAARKPATDLVAHGLTHRPEVAEQSFLAGEAAQRLKRARYAPLVPSLVLGVSYGGLGGGFGSSYGDFGDRLDVDAVAWWEVKNLGQGDRAGRREARSRLNQAHWRTAATLDRVAAEVVEARAQVESREKQRATAELGIRAAESSLARNLERIRNAQGLPLEALQSIQALAQARREYLRVVLSYNEAQFRLHHALGWPSGPIE